MQNAAWPITIVQMLNGIPAELLAELGAMPVTTPGSATGSTRGNETEFRPKKRNRGTANAAAEPRMSAATVATSATVTEVASAWRTSGLCQARPKYLVVKCWIGHLCPMLALNAYTATRRSGSQRNRIPTADPSLMRTR